MKEANNTGKKTGSIIGGIVLGLALCGIVIFLSLYLGGKPWKVVPESSQEQSSQTSSGSSQSQSDPEEDEQELRGVWAASVLNLDFPSRAGLTADELRAEIDEIVSNTKKWGLNAIFLQVRPSCDALYASQLFPVSEFLNESRTLPDGFDPLEYVVTQAHAAGLELHAWINPLRVTCGSTGAPQHDVSALPENSPARLHPDWTVPFADGKLYFDAGVPQVRQLIVDGVKEIIDGSDVDGIHFDDYFYPYPVSGATFDDAASFAQYGGGKTLEDWRRDNITAIIEGVNSAVEASGKDISFGVAPFAVWKNASGGDALGSDTNGGIQTYSDLYADTRKWVKDGSVDYICPQIYWTFTQTGVEYDKVYDWWRDCVEGTDVQLIVGHAFYKSGGESGGWEDPEQIVKQVQYSRESGNYGGSIFYRYAFLKENPADATALLSEYYASLASGGGQVETTGDYPADYGPIPLIGTDNSGKIIIGYGNSGYSIWGSRGSIMGSANPSLPLYCNGEAVPLTKNGMFSVFKTLDYGTNTFVFTQGDATVTYYVTRLSGSSDATQTPEYWGAQPAANCLNTFGSELLLAIYTRSDCSVTANVNGRDYALVKSEDGGSYYHTLEITDMPSGLGKVKYTLNYGLSSSTAESEGEVTVMAPEAGIFVKVAQDNAVIRHTTTNVARWNVPVLNGTVLKADRLFDGMYYLSDFGMISEKMVETTDEEIEKSYIYGARITENDDAYLIDFMKTGAKAVDIDAYSRTIRFTVYGYKPSGTPAYADVTALAYPNFTAERFENRVEYTYRFSDALDFCGFTLENLDGGVRIRLKKPVVLDAADAAKPLTGLRVALNFGHGPNSGAPGAMGYDGWLEDQMNWDVVLRTRAQLMALGAQVDLISTMDNPITIEEVVLGYDAGDYDLAVSVHFNAVLQSADVGTVSGTYAYYAYPDSLDFARYLGAAVEREAGRTNKGAVRDSFYVTRTYTCPSVLMEMEYICNPNVYDWLCADANRDSLARGISTGICDYLSAREK